MAAEPRFSASHIQESAADLEKRIQLLSDSDVRTLAVDCSSWASSRHGGNPGQIISAALGFDDLDWAYAGDVGRGLARYPEGLNSRLERTEAARQGRDFAQALGEDADSTALGTIPESTWAAAFEDLRVAVAVQIAEGEAPTEHVALLPEDLVVLLELGIAYGQQLMAALEDENSQLRTELAAAQLSSDHLRVEVESLRERIAALTEALDAARRSGDRRAGRARFILSGVFALLSSGVGAWIGVELAHPPAIEVRVDAPANEATAKQFVVICADAAARLDPGLRGTVETIPDLPSSQGSDPAPPGR